MIEINVDKAQGPGGGCRRGGDAGWEAPGDRMRERMAGEHAETTPLADESPLGPSSWSHLAPGPVPCPPRSCWEREPC